MVSMSSARNGTADQYQAFSRKHREMSTYQLREKCGIDSKTVRRLRANENIETKTLDKLCVALSCRLEDIAEYVPDHADEARTGTN